MVGYRQTNQKTDTGKTLTRWPVFVDHFNSKGYQYLHTKDFVSALRRRGIHLSEVEANAWIAREQSYFIDRTAEHSENRLWMMANMGRVL